MRGEAIVICHPYPLLASRSFTASWDREALSYVYWAQYQSSILS
jgi:hypothetical protein